MFSTPSPRRRESPVLWHAEKPPSTISGKLPKALSLLGATTITYATTRLFNKSSCVRRLLGPYAKIAIIVTALWTLKAAWQSAKEACEPAE